MTITNSPFIDTNNRYCACCKGTEDPILKYKTFYGFTTDMHESCAKTYNNWLQSSRLLHLQPKTQPQTKIDLSNIFKELADILKNPGKS